MSLRFKLAIALASSISLLSFAHTANAYSANSEAIIPELMEYAPVDDGDYIPSEESVNAIAESIKVDYSQFNYDAPTQAELVAFDLFSWIRIPSFQGSNAFDGIFRGAIAHFFMRSIGSAIRAEMPVVLDANYIYPIVDLLPALQIDGVEYTLNFTEEEIAKDWYAAPYGSAETDPTMTAALVSTVSQLARTQTTSVPLPPGDYAIPIELTCVVVNTDLVPSYNRYILAPLRGRRAAAIAALNASSIDLDGAIAARNRQLAQDDVEAEVLNVLANNLGSDDLKSLAVALQAGLPYEKMVPEVRALVDLLLPEYFDQIQGGFLTQAEIDYERFTDSHPSVTFPTFDEVLDNLGPLGPAVQSYRQLRDNIISSEGDYQSIMTSLYELQDSQRETGSDDQPFTGETPWSVLHERVYARLLAEDPCFEPPEGSEITDSIVQAEEESPSAKGTLQVRVLPSNGLLGAAPIDVPIMGILGDPRDPTFFPVVGIPRLPD
ncbi:MAG: hypothetical protein AAF329_04490 [Cyanobacteria bacterium P01_A01_bin.17]